ncbi:hypothetical protein ACF07W_15095 [Streptomyces sp. NPDC015140]|uniref:hypothetical protein n=1 Tax=Streptomyces sp. NPDC015140 TaxID=3364943 RepID=UPI0036F82EA3
MLQVLGLGPAEEAIYSALMARPTASPQDLARQTGQERAESTRILLDLAARGLAALATEADGGTPDSAGCEAGSRPDRYRLTPLSVALAPLLVEQRNALQRAEAAYSMLTEQYRGRRRTPPAASWRWSSAWNRSRTGSNNCKGVPRRSCSSFS